MWLPDVIRFRMPTAVFRLRQEIRPKDFKGPERACHLDEVEICLIDDGYEVGTIEGVERRHEHGRYVVIPAGHEHSSWTERASVAETILHVDALALREQAAQMGLRGELTAGTFTTGRELQHIIALLRSASDGLARDALLTFVRAWLLERHLGVAAVVAETSSLETKLQKLEAALRDDPARTRSLATMAASVGLSEFHFLRTFKKRYGRPPHAYLLGLRLERAAVMLRDRDVNVTTVAHACGFASGAELSRAFKRKFGVAPSQFAGASRRAEQSLPSVERKIADDASRSGG